MENQGGGVMQGGYIKPKTTQLSYRSPNTPQYTTTEDQEEASNQAPFSDNMNIMSEDGGQ